MAESGSREWLAVYLKGMLMGAADTIPGVSGGTIALITGIYERLVTAIASLDPRPLRHLLRPWDAEERGRLADGLSEMGVPFLLVLGAGIATAVVGLSRFMHAALVQYPVPTNALFFGLIAASAVVLYREVSVDTVGRAAAAVVGFLVAFLVTGVSGGGGVGHSLPVVFLSGAVASAAMLLPGISGAAFLYILGQYEFLTGRLTRFVDAVVAMPGGAATLAADAAIIAAFLAGLAVGVLTIAHAVRWAMEHYREATLVALVSLMVGALRLPVENILAGTDGWTAGAVGAVAIAAAAGAALVLGLDRSTDDLTY